MGLRTDELDFELDPELIATTPAEPRDAARLLEVRLPPESEDQGEAMELHQKCLAIELATLGPDHPDVATSYNNMAVTLKKQGKHAEAMVLYRKCLAIRLAKLEPDHPHVAMENTDSQ